MIHIAAAEELSDVHGLLGDWLRPDPSGGALAVPSRSDARHEIAGIGTRLRWLGDIVPVPLPVRPEVVSPGDVLVAAGLAELVVLGMLGRGMMGSVLHRKETLHGEEGA